MNKPEFKLLPCVFCTLGYNTYVAGYRLLGKGVELINGDSSANGESNIEHLTPVTVKPSDATTLLKK